MHKLSPAATHASGPPPVADSGAAISAVLVDRLFAPRQEPADWASLSNNERRPNELLFDRQRLADAFLHAAALYADRAAVITDDGWYCYRSIVEGAESIASCLQNRQGLAPGTRVLLLLENGPEYLASFYGTLLAGCVAVPVPPNVEAKRLMRIVEACDIPIALTTAEIIRRRADCRFAATGSIEPGTHLRQPRCHVDPLRIQGESLAMILFTSGSTGEPKGVMLSDANLLANARSIIGYLPIRTGDRALALLPFCHAFGNSVLQTHILCGATLVISGSIAFPTTVVDALRGQRITSFSAVPEVCHALLAYSNFGDAPLEDLRYVTVAGGALGRDPAVALAQRIAPAKLYVMYGQTEAAARLAYLPPEELLRRPDSIGRAIPGVQLKVADERKQEVPPGTIGTLYARGRNVMLGYWQDPAGTAEAIQDGWLNTGDLATADENGFFYIKGRSNGLIKLQGLRVHPREIEETISRIVGNCRVAVVPYCQREMTRLALFVVAAGQELPSVEEIRRHCLRELPRAKVPSYIEVIDQLPLSSALKVDRAALTQRAQAQALNRKASLAYSITSAQEVEA